MLLPFRLSPIYRDYVWGGKKLRPDAELTAEAWVVCEDAVVIDGQYSGQTLAKVVELEGEALLGSKVIQQTGKRFPLLIKLLDCEKWLSLQVHPNNKQAEILSGPEHFGKTEAWFVIEAENSARLICGFRPGTNSEDVLNAVGKKDLLGYVEFKEVQAGETFFITPGTIHALGPGLLIYEIQQNSDITYRIYDWDRPMDGGRKLHLAESVFVLNPDENGNIFPKKSSPNLVHEVLVTCEFFTLELLNGKSEQILNSNGDSFSVITPVNKEIVANGMDWSYTLMPLESLLIPAECTNNKITIPIGGKVLFSYITG